MERVFTIKTKSLPDLSNQYPSERRYSASTVLGISTVVLQLALCSIIMGTLIIHRMHLLEPASDDNSTKRLSEKLQRDLEYSDQTYLHYYINIPVLISVGCFVMAFGDVLVVITGLLAWKRWYIDHNITFFFIACSFSTLTSVASLVITTSTISNIEFNRMIDYETGKGLSPLSPPLVINIIALSLISCIWCVLSTTVAYKGMRNSYPGDIVVKGGPVEVSTVQRGKRNNINNIPIEVINNFAVGNMAKYLPKVENNDMPKRESKAEYRQRVEKFLSAQPETEVDNEDKNRAEDEIKPPKNV